MVAVSKHLPDDRLTEDEVSKWLASLPPVQEPDKREQLVNAVRLVLDVFGDEIERTGQQLALYILHVADLLVHFELDDETLAAAVLYRIYSAEARSEQELRADYSDVIVNRVLDLARIQRLTPGVLAAREEEGEEHSENLRRMLLAISNDVQVLLIILAERVHLMRRLGNLPEPIQQQFSRNTRDIFAPIANRLGIWQIKWELEDLSLRFLDPDSYRHIAKRLEERRDERLAFIKRTIGVLEEEVSKAGIEADISGRPKHIFSIWKKMQRKDKDFSHIFDVRALRVLVDTVADCYAALGVVHSLWRHLPKEFDDYIATPKANLYQSIHTVVVGDDGKPLEIQIRTHEMHEHAERGVAAHWRYKEQRGQNQDLEKRIEWMRQWLEQRDDGRGAEGGESDEDSQHNIYVLSPQGKVIELPYGSTAVDFAYAIHTSVGHRCRGAKIDGRIAPLTQKLENGQTVEVITAKQEQPSRDWLSAHLGYVATPRARNRIRQWYRQQDYSSHVEMGREILERELTRLSMSRPNLSAIAPNFNLNSDEDLYAAIGRGDVSPVQVATWEQREQLQQQREEQRKTGGTRRRKKRSPAAKGKGPQLVVEGIDSVMTKLGQCCKPVPGDPVIGFITRGHGITVHRQDCSVITKMRDEEKERLIEVRWEEPDESGAGSFNVDIRIIGIDRKGLVRDLSSIMANEDIDILSMRTHSDKKRQQAVMRFTIEISDISELKHLLEKVSRLPDIISASRVTD